MKRGLCVVALAMLPALSAVPATPPPQAASQAPRDFEALPFAPRRHVCYRAPSTPAIDGNLEDAAWLAAPWTDDFVDIEGETRPRPRFRTRAKMLWDGEYFYVAAAMEEPDLWGTLTERDSIVYHDNDFEVFVDPDGDTQQYYELEVNPLGTVFDLFLPRAYRDGGPPIIAWDVAGLRLAVSADGTVNDPRDRDRGWTVEMAIPWKVLREAAPGKRPPRGGDQWRVNFSRVEYTPDATGGRYAKRTDQTSGRPMPADNWVWSPQGVVDVHLPERWGYVQFSDVRAGSGTEMFLPDPNENVKWALRRLYYRQRRFRAANGRYAERLDALNPADIRVEARECGVAGVPVPPACQFAPTMQATADLYEIRAAGFGGATVHIQQDGRVWLTR